MFIGLIFYQQAYLHLCKKNTMIQRIQSVYLLLVAIAGALTYFFPIVSLVPSPEAANNAVYHLSALQLVRMAGDTTEIMMRPWTVVVLGVISIALSLFIISQYQKRSFQIRLTHLLMMLLLAEIVFIVYSAESLKNLAGTEHMISFNFFSTLPLVQVILTRLASAAIKRDEALVRSADRLR